MTGVALISSASRTRKSSRDEYSCRRPSFRSGNQIQLSDGQTWTLPAPPKKSERGGGAFADEYLKIIQAIVEAEDKSERSIAELVLAIYLLQSNYYLAPAEYQILLSSSPRARDSSDWQSSFHQIADKHLCAAM
jgi:hypothetical protein